MVGESSPSFYLRQLIPSGAPVQTIKQNDAQSYWNTAKNKFLKIGVTGTDNTPDAPDIKPKKR